MTSFLGRVTGDYRLESLIGRGNLGDTFVAVHIRTGRKVVVKVLHPRMTTDNKFPDRFRQIVTTAQGLRHPNVVPIEAFGGDAGVFYVAMEFFPDGSLRTLLQRRSERLPLGRAVHIVRHAADALSAAHAHSVIHRDVKPENILVMRQSNAADIVKVADFGFTRLSEGGLTMGGNDVFGSLPYMSPEQSRWASVDARTDIYSLGVVLYEAVTGLVPFQVKTLQEAMDKHVNAQPPSPRSVAPQLPLELEGIILRCLAKNPVDRFASASELSSALGRLALDPWPPVVVVPDAQRPVVTLKDSGRAVRVESDAPAAQQPIIRVRDEKPVATPAVKADAAPAVSTPERKSYYVKLDQSAMQAEAGAAAASALPAPPPVDVTPSPPPPRPQAGPINVIMNPERGPRPSHLPPDRGKQQPAGAASGQSRRIHVALEKETLALTPGVPSILQVSVVNGGPRVDFLTVTVEGVPEKWVEVPPNPPQLTPNAGATVPVKIVVPRSSKSRAGEYTVTIRARSRYEPSESSTATARWTVLPFASASIDVSPSLVRGWRRAVVQATLSNDGNAPSRFALSGNDNERALRYAVSEKELTLEPGERKTVAIRITAPFRFIGSTETRAFSVEATPIVGTAPLSALSPQIVQGQFVQRAAIPTFVPPLLLGLAIAIYALWPRKVPPPPPSPPQVKVTPNSVVVPVGDSATVAATVTNAKNELTPDQEVLWSSRDTNIVTVLPGGVVHAVREGRTTIVAQQGQTTAEAAVEVVAAKLAEITVTPPQITLKVGGTQTLTARATDANGRAVQRPVTWTSSDPSVATVGGDGRIVAKGAGLATITAQLDEKRANTQVRVDSVPKPVVVAGPAGPVEDCQDYDPASIAFMNRPGPGWMVTDGGKTVLMTLDNQQDAQRAFALARRYKAHCFLGRLNKRPNRSDYVREYWKTPSGLMPPIDHEECASYDPNATAIQDRGAEGFAVVSGRQLYLLTDTRDDAQRIWDLARHNTAHCLIGAKNKRENKRDFTVEYWR